MVKCGNCGEEIDGSAYSLDSDPDVHLCSHCHRVMKNGEQKGRNS